MRLKFVSAAIAVAMLSACGPNVITPKTDLPAPANLPMDLFSQLRGVDADENGIRDSVEMAITGMAVNLTDNLRLLSYAWSLQQGMEVSALSQDAVVFKKATQIMLDATACAIDESMSIEIAENLMKIHRLTVDTPLRQEAWNSLQTRTMNEKAQPSSEPCTESDVLSAMIISKTIEAKRLVNQMQVKPVAKPVAPTEGVATTQPEAKR